MSEESAWRHVRESDKSDKSDHKSGDTSIEKREAKRQKK